MGEEAAYSGVSAVALYWFLGFVVAWSTVMAGVIKMMINRMISDLDKRLAAHDDDLEKVQLDTMELSLRLGAINEAMKHAPNHDDIKNLHRRLDDVSGKIERQTGVLTVIRDLIQKEHSE